MALARTRANVSARKRNKRVEAGLPRTDAPEHPIDPADAAFLDPAAVARAATPAPSASGEGVPDTPGYGDFEGERAPRGRNDADGGTDRNASGRKAGR